MKKLRLIPLFVTCLVAVISSSCALNKNHVTTGFPAGIDHGPWNSLLGKYVDDRGLVNYAGLKANKADLAKLDSYLADFGKTDAGNAKGNELVATAANAYNAFAIRTIVSNYPVSSIRKIDGAFSKKTHKVGDKMLSLDDIEKGNVVPNFGADAHAIVVCCAKSCPPLQNKAYTAGNLKSLAATAAAAWMGRKDLNDFTSEKDEIKISKIFDWYKSDFEKAGGVKKWVKKHAPNEYSSKIDKSEIKYLNYNWDLNSQ